jgi:hypothetical protein
LDPRDQHLLKLAKAGLKEAKGRLWWSSGRDLTDSLDRTWKKKAQDGRPMWETVSSYCRSGLDVTVR